MPNPNTAAADLPNPITAALTDVLVGVETSFNRLSVVPLIAGVPPRAPSYVTLDEALAGGDFEVTEISEAGRVPELHVLNTGNQPVLHARWRRAHRRQAEPHRQSDDSGAREDEAADSRDVRRGGALAASQPKLFVVRSRALCARACPKGGTGDCIAR